MSEAADSVAGNTGALFSLLFQVGDKGFGIHCVSLVPFVSVHLMASRRSFTQLLSTGAGSTKINQFSAERCK